MKHTLSFHTVFIVNENIRWLEEFIQYYKKIGFDHFYLYDNEGTNGSSVVVREEELSSSFINQNKYGFQRTNITSKEDREKFNMIMDKYKNDITYVKWQPKNENGEIIYNQKGSIKHFIENYGHETEWIACMDFDEYLFSPDNINIPEYLNKLGNEISCVKVCQKKFIDRHLSDKTNMLEEFRCVDLYVGEWWGAKNIFRPTDFIDFRDIHNISVKNKTHSIGQHLLRFNHHNVNSSQIEWMDWSMGGNFTLDGIDDSMKRYL